MCGAVWCGAVCWCTSLHFRMAWIFITSRFYDLLMFGIMLRKLCRFCVFWIFWSITKWVILNQRKTQFLLPMVHMGFPLYSLQNIVESLMYHLWSSGFKSQQALWFLGHYRQGRCQRRNKRGIASHEIWKKPTKVTFLV